MHFENFEEAFGNFSELLRTYLSLIQQLLTKILILCFVLFHVKYVSVIFVGVSNLLKNMIATSFDI